jgi:hypothetical protein
MCCGAGIGVGSDCGGCVSQRTFVRCGGSEYHAFLVVSYDSVVVGHGMGVVSDA